MPVPLLSWFLAFFAGILLADQQDESIFPYALGVIALVAAIGLQFSPSRLRLLRLTTLVIVLALGCLNALSRDVPFPDDHIWKHLQHDKRARVEGIIVDRPESFPDKTRFRVELRKIAYGSGWNPVSGVAQISLYGDPVDLEWGQRVRFPSIRLRRPLNFRNPGRFDFERFMESRGIDVTGGTSRRKNLKVLGTESLSGWESTILTLRDRMASLLERGLPQEGRAMVSGMVFGEKSGISPEILEAYQVTGMGHLLAVSGLHIGFVTLIFFSAGNRLLFNLMWHIKPAWAQYGYVRKGAAVGTLSAVLFYMTLVGPKVSSIRAGILVMAVLIALWIHRERQILNTILLAAFLILLWDPGAVYQLGFQLSFSAVLAIVLGFRWIAEPKDDPLEKMGEIPWYRRWAVPDIPTIGWGNRLVDILMASAFISVTAYIGTLPILLFHFHRISLVAPFMNVLLVPLASILIPGCLLVLFLGMLIPSLALPMLLPLGWLAMLFVKFPVWVSSLPQISVYLPTPHWTWIFCYALFFIGISYRFYLRRQGNEQKSRTIFGGRFASWSLGAVGFLLLLGLMAPRLLQAKNNRLHLWLLDVGQGESIFIEFPDGQNMLMDGGGFFRGALDVGTQVVGSFLWSRGIGQIDFLGSTHSDQDHIDGVESLLEKIRVKKFLSRRDGMGDRRYNRLVSRAVVRDVPLLEFGPEHPLKVGDVVLRNLHPTDAFNRQSGASGLSSLNNDQSWVILLEYREFRILLTGDISEKSEGWLLDQGIALKAQVLKSPHHGSKTSSSQEFIDAVGARDVLISSGFANYFHHPHKKVVQRYLSSGARVWNTGQLGALHLTTDGRTYKIETHEGLSHWNNNRTLDDRIHRESRH